MRVRRSRIRGISLIEAMVALAVMAFGTLGVLGVQTTLRLNADIAKQRNEAVRIGQETIETARSFEAVRSVDPDADTWAGIVDTVVDPVLGYTVANTSYRVETRVEEAAGLHDPRAKTVVVDVSWKDRSGQDQSIQLSSSIHGVPPALAGSLALPTDSGPVRNPGERHPAIPRDAVPSLQDPGTSSFTPPGADEVRWDFSNLTGYITQICVADACTPLNARLLAGYVRFATAAAIGNRQPVGADAEVPPGIAFAMDVAVNQTLPILADRGGRLASCYQRLEAGLGISYFCAIPVGDTGAWSGRSVLVHPDITAVFGEAAVTKLRVCRYTPYRAHRAVGPNPNTQMRNDEHPLDYAGVRTSLINQNFLVIQAGNDAVAFDCPDDIDDPDVVGDEADDDAPASPFLSGRTWHHQPAN
jgi:Tfp pilus assembly protein PilV